MLLTPEFPIRVFYDGSCSICARKVEHYGRQDQAKRLTLVDISAQGFDPTPFGITQREFMYQMHVIDLNGRVYRGVDALWAIWQAFPSSTLPGFFGKLISLPVLNPIARRGYRIFACIRGYLPKRRRSCSGESCRTGGR